MGSGVIICIPDFINIGSGIENLIVGHIQDTESTEIV
jgi:hypothetical protein